MRWVGQFGMRLLGGWQITGKLPEVPKAIIVIAPHTSNWDFFVGLFVMFKLRLKLSFLGKHSLFVFPINRLLRWVGGIPIKRNSSAGSVGQMIEAFKAHKELVLVITPEGTRKKVKKWKTGFLHMAKEAKVPVIPVAMDYARRCVDILPALNIEGEVDEELKRVQACVLHAQGKNPENT